MSRCHFAIFSALLALLTIVGATLQRPALAANDAPAVGQPAIVLYTKDNPPPTPRLEDLPLQQSISQNGITWTFDKPARVGRFLTGDWYVVGPVTVQAIDPKPLFGDEVTTAPAGKTEALYKGQYARNGSTLNLPARVPPNKVTPRTARSGFDSRMDMAAYDPDQFTPLPIAMKPGDSLVSSSSAEPGDTFPIQAVAILTCVAGPQPPDAFRPSYCQTAACPTYLARNLRRDLLLKLPRPASAARLNPQDYVDCFHDPWIDTVGYGRAMPKRKGFAFYGPSIAAMGGGCSLLLLMDYTPQQKESLLVNMVQVGIDLHGLLRGGAEWHAEGGGNAGRKWLILFAGLMLDDPKMYALTKYFPDGRFHEDEQTVFCPVEYDGKTFEHGWTGAKVIWAGHFGYYKGQFPPKQWASGYGPVDLFPPDQWPSPWNIPSESYRRAMTSPAWVAQALAAHLMHAEKLWDHNAFFAYVDRWMNEDDGPVVAAMLNNAQAKIAAANTDAEKAALEKAKAAIQSCVRSGTISGPSEMLGMVNDLWKTYRDHLPPAPDASTWPPAETTWK